MVLQCSEQCCELYGVECFLVVYKGYAERDVVLIGLLLELADGLEVIDGRVPWPKAGLLPWLVLIQCVKHSLQEDVGEYLVDDGKKVNGAVVLDVGHVTFLWRRTTAAFLQELGTRPSDRHRLKRLVRIVTMVSPPPCRMPPVILSSPGALSLFILLMAALFCDERMLGGGERGGVASVLENGWS